MHSIQSDLDYFGNNCCQYWNTLYNYVSLSLLDCILKVQMILD